VCGCEFDNEGIVVQLFAGTQSLSLLQSIHSSFRAQQASYSINAHLHLVPGFGIYEPNLHSPYATAVCTGTHLLIMHTPTGYQQLEVRISITCENKMINTYDLTASR
jgi:hypothetical protein